MKLSKYHFAIPIAVVLALAAILVVSRGARIEPPSGSSGGSKRDSMERVLSRIDLLNVLDLPKDAIAGHARFDGKALVTPEQRFGRVLIPYKPPSEYDLEMKVQRISGEDSLAIGLIGEGRQFVVVVSGGEEPSTGLDLLDGQPFYSNETTLKGNVFEPNRVHEIKCEVRRDSLKVVIDDKALVDWDAEYNRVSLYRHWKVTRSDALFVGSYNTVYRIVSMTLFPKSGPGRLLE